MKKIAIAILGASLLCATAYAEDMQAASPSTEGQSQMQSTDAKKAGDAFLAANKAKPGVVTTSSGLQYKVLTPGNGQKPTATDVVTVDYAGTLINGKEFDSSYKRGEPATFPVNGVIPGWTEALQLMNKGSTWELYIPASLAYGDQGAPPVIGPNETLVFKVHLIDVKKQ